MLEQVFTLANRGVDLFYSDDPVRAMEVRARHQPTPSLLFDPRL